jgi:vitamin B12 transporter
MNDATLLSSTLLSIEIRKIIVLFICLPAQVVAQVQSDEITLFSPMIVQSDTTDMTANSQTSITRDALEFTQMPDISNVLRSQAGIAINQGSAQMMSSISLRGSGGAGQGLITLDGIPLFGNFAGLYSLSHYSLDALDYVSLTRGVGGERHGSRTLGGTIHLQTRQFQHDDTFLHFEGGSYDTVRGEVGKGVRTQLGDFSGVIGHSDVFSGRSQAKNGRERDNFDMTHASGNWVKKFAKGSVNASLYFVRTDEDMDGPGRVGNKTQWVDDRLGRLSDETWVTQVQGEYDLNTYWNTSLQAGFTQDRQNMITTRIKPFAITNQLMMLDWRNTHHLFLDTQSTNQAQLIWGVNTQHQQNLNFTATQTVISPNVRGELALNDWRFVLDGRFDLGWPYGDHSVFSVGVERIFSERFQLYANGGTGFRQPAVSELMHPVFGNKNLQSESSAGGEIGLRWKVSPLTHITVNGYYQKYHDMITLQLDSTTGAIRAQNVQEADVFGSELQTQHQWNADWESGFTYHYLSAVNPTAHLQIANRPAHQGGLWNQWHILPPLTWRIEFNIHDGFWFDAKNSLRATVAPRINTLLKYEVTPQTQLYLRGENITNNQSLEINDFNFYGACVYVGFRANF